MEGVAFVSERRFTQAQFWRLMKAVGPDALGKYELIDGRIVVTPPVGYPHGETESIIIAGLREAAEVRGRVFGSSQGFDLPTGDTLEPDASFISNRRWRRGPPPQRGKFLRIVPDLVVEILSPESRARDLGRKREIYAAAGVREYWVIDVDRRRVLRFRLDRDPDAPAEIVGGRQILRTPLLPKLRLRVSGLFPRP